ncbi:uncharacterized protein CANTADRAFT_23167 [Suhomyces tanzawaensis NRRL Y-17324]|uniref:Shugoshin N-terminal coiled-coil domain-containing protein n=1 Tax=Suhomyces tanzawaensis NRRL Y-17324 TaxID=984487 RepID=A0A1E4SEU9_9ASCO|nr:uncharacterized protein CANTADRAFT_23167 [Suhomyces tanzawaensis NRRL Y-17324]ODV78059.1 hypothetical protein CANTADRAFT_23167 [Suhomyces tanzawaensis NRRL Y-17324]
MARKSIDFSQSLLKFQGSVPDRSEPKNPAVSARFRPFEDPKQSSPPQDDLANEKSLKHKYTQQNTLLARTNAMMQRKMNDMETRLVELSNENNKLKKSHTNRSVENKRQLEHKVEMIEGKLFEKFADILQLMKHLRWEEGLTANPQLDVLNEINRPITSTPIESEPTMGSPFGLIGPSGSMFGQNEGIPKSLHPEEVPDFSKDVTDSQVNQTFLDEEVTEYAKIDKFSTILEDKEPSETSKIADPDPVQAEIPKSPSPQISTSDWLAKANELIKENELSKSRKAKSSEWNENEKQKHHEQTVTNTQHEIPPKKVKHKGKALVVNTEFKGEIEQQQNLESKSPIIDLRSSREVSSEIEDIKEEPVGRPRRARKKVDYKPVPLRAKMRRESVKLLDAVGENVLINYAVSKRPTDEEVERKRRNDEEQNDSSTKRKPLSVLKDNVIRNSNPESKTVISPNAPILEQDKENQMDMSVFDFEEGGPRRRSVYVGKKTARRNRRQTMM